MAVSASFVIIGASLVGVRAAEALREAGYAEAITLIGDEVEPPKVSDAALSFANSG